MCEVPSWIETDGGKVFYLTDKTIIAWHEENRPGQAIKWEDFTGHSGIRIIYPGIGGKDKEGINKNTPKECINSLIENRMNELLKHGDICVDGVAVVLQVTSIGGYVDVMDNGKLSMPQVTSIGGGVDVRENGKLSMPQVTSIGGYVDVRENGKLSMPQVTSIGGDVYVMDNGKLSMPQVTSIGGDVDVRKNGKLSMPQVTSIGGDVYGKINYI